MSTEYVSYEFDTFALIDELLNRKCIGFKAHSVLVDLLQCGGFIAGGFARRCMHHLGASVVDGQFTLQPGLYSEHESDRPKPDDDEKTRRSLRAYEFHRIGNYLGQEEMSILRAGPWKGNKNDIDVFFPSQVIRDDVVTNHPWPDDENSRESIGNNAINVYCDNKTFVQVITRFFAPVEETLDSFDITNGAVALLKDMIVFPKVWFELEQTRTLKVNHWRHDQTPRRINMWMHKHKFTQLHTDDLGFFNEKLEELFNRLASGEKIMVDGSEKILYDLGKFLNNLKDPFYASHMNGYMLTLFASLAPFYDDYNWAMNELKRRGLPLAIQ